ncbi:hypothetical protein F2Q68_00038912 [Brassica cretica]|uniref:Uncharacterized protein n=1 Tax=Brassica cretica TaxID=69181 RepID=A0A8S9MTD3_BRACR|nr:hypothetical protein F2Q68_00038912 [Brassica cretica]
MANMLDMMIETNPNVNPALASRWQSLRPTFIPERTQEEQADLERRTDEHSFDLFDEIYLNTWFFSMKVAFGGVNSVSHPPRQPGRSHEQTGASNALAFPGSKSTQKGVTECSCCWSNFTSKGLLCAKRQKMLEDMEKDFEGGQEADKLDGGGGSKSSGSLDIRFRVEKVQARV